MVLAKCFLPKITEYLAENFYISVNNQKMTHTFTYDKGSIRLVVSHNGKVYRRATGLTTRLWDASARKILTKCKDAAVRERLAKIDSRLKEREGEARREADVLKIMEWALTGDETALSGSRSSRPTFWEYFRAWGERPSPVRRQRRLYPNIVSRLMGEAEDWEDIDSSYYFRLCKKMDDAGYSVNTKGAVISKLKVAMNEGYKLKYHANAEFREFKSMSETPETIALTGDELDALWKFKTKSSWERKARDLFIIGVYSAARWEDYSRFTLGNISDGRLSYSQLKTGATVIIPAAPRLVSCLKRNGGASPKLSQQKYNEAIKVVCEKIGMTQPVHYSIGKGAGREHLVKRRCDMVSSHTARRTGATLLYKSGVPIKQCMMVTGHKTESTFLGYIRISKEENAALLADNPFFK